MALHSQKQARIEVTETVDKSLNEWGLRPLHSVQHSKFRERTINKALAHLDDSLARHPSNQDLFESRVVALQRNCLPRDPIAAIRHVLQAEIEGAETEDNLYVIKDSLGMLWEPFYESKDNRSGRLSYPCKKDFEKFSRKELDPLKRFSMSFVSPKEYIYNGWSDINCLGGTIYEALAACQLVFHEACFQCHGRNVLRWNGGHDDVSSWSDVLCVSCQSTYEIKSKRNAEMVRKALLFNIPAGSYRTFCSYRPAGKRFLVLISRQSSVASNSPSTYAHPLMVMEIAHVSPRVGRDSFASQMEGRVAFKTVVTVGTARTWCEVPACHANFLQLAKEVYSAHFGKSTWDDLATSTRKPESTAITTVANSKNKLEQRLEEKRKNEEKLAAVKKSLESLRVEDCDDDNWETMYDIGDG